MKFEQVGPPIFRNWQHQWKMISFDSEYKEMVDLDVMAIAAMCETEGRPIPPVQLKEVKAAMKRLKNNKAADIMGLTSEHFKMEGGVLTEFLTSFLNYIISTKKCLPS